jgi:hypothetical protein
VRRDDLGVVAPRPGVGDNLHLTRFNGLGFGRLHAVAQALVEQFVGLSVRRLTTLLTDRTAPKGDAPQF